MNIKPEEKVPKWTQFKAWLSQKLRLWVKSWEIDVTVEIIDGPHEGESRVFQSACFAGDMFYRWYGPKKKFAIYEMITQTEARHCGWAKRRRP